ncbi:MAG: M23 family metallopeptidase [Cyanobacteria bacterium J06632_22]
MKDAPQPSSPPAHATRRPLYAAEPKRRCTVTVTESGWFGAKAAAEAIGCVSLSDMIERLGRGELAVLPSDEFPSETYPGEASGNRAPLSTADAAGFSPEFPHDISAGHSPRPAQPPLLQSLWRPITQTLAPLQRLPRLFLTASCAALVLMPVLYVVNLTTETESADFTPNLAGVPETGDQVAGYDVTDHFRIRPVHPVTGARNVPHNGVDVATPAGTPVYAVGAVGDTVTVKCWWDVDGGGWVANQTTASLSNYVFQSLHLQENECRSGEFKAGEVIALTGNTGIGTGAHYDFRVKIDGQYVPPDRVFLESALTGNLLNKDS